VEFTREVARHFNARYGDTFPECKALLTATPRVLGLDGDAKMSKSRGNTIGILETSEQIWDKLRPAKTDPARVKRSDPGTPEKCTIWSYHLLVTPEAERPAIHDGCTSAGIGCIDCKKILHANLMKVLDPIRARYAELSGPRRAEVESRLEANAERCREVARATMLEVKGKMGLKKVWKI
jgi:tryptophanyl-tRNA synthetase